MVEQRAPVPVAIDVAGPVRSQLERVVEGALGWQVVAVDDPVLPPRCVLVDPPRAPVPRGGTVPVALVTLPDDDPRRGSSCRLVPSTAVLDGIPDAATLPTAGGATPRLPGPAGRMPLVHRRRLRGWRGRDHRRHRARRAPGLAARADAAGGARVPTTSSGAPSGRRRATWPVRPRGRPRPRPSASTASGSCACASAARVGRRRPRAARARARRRGPAADVLVVRPDRAGLAAVEAGTGAVVVVGRGAVGPGRPARSRRRPARGRLPVVRPGAAAAAQRRMPADLPGTWLRPLADVVRRLEARAMGGGVTALGAGRAARRRSSDGSPRTCDVQAAGLGDRAVAAARRRPCAGGRGRRGPARPWAALVRALVDDLAGLGPLEQLLRDPSVTDVCCNGPSEVWVERAGRLERSRGPLRR